MNKWNPMQEAFDNSRFNPNLGHSGQASKESGTTLFVRGVPTDFTDSAFKNLFAKYGKVTYTKLLELKDPGHKTRNGFIGYGSYYEAQDAISKLNNCKLGPSVLHVDFARPRKPKNQATYQNLSEKLNVGRMIDADAKHLIKKTQETFPSSHHYQKKNYPRTSKPENYLENPLRSSASDQSKSSGSDTSPRNITTKSFVNSSFNSSQNRSRKSSTSQDEIPIKPSKGFLKSSSPVGNYDRNSHFNHKPSASEKKPEPNPCKICGKMTQSYCTSCKVTFYCSQLCQKQDWKAHKKVCKKLASECSSEFNAGDPSVCLDESFCQKVAENLFESVKKIQLKSKVASFPDDIKENTTLNLFVVDIIPTSAILVCRHACTSDSELEKQQMALNDFYNNRKGTVLSNPGVGDFCAALYSEDKKWYRAKVRQFESNEQVGIQFLDYGNSESVNLTELVYLEERFCKLPAFCIMCKLAGTDQALGWTESQFRFLVDILKSNGTKLTAECTRIVGEFFFGQFWSNDVSINDKMAHLTPIKASKMNQSPPYLNRSSSPKYDSPRNRFSANASPGRINNFSPGRNQVNHKRSISQVNIPRELFDAYISFIETPDSFYCEVVDESFLKMHSYLPELNQHFSSNKVDFKPEVGDICAAYYQEDQQWCRAKVMEVLNSHQCKVSFVDFGNSADVPYNQVQPLPDKYCSLPMQAFKASLANCYPPNGRCWPIESIKFFKHMENSSCKVRAIKHSNRGDSNVAVILYINEDKSFNDELVARGLAISEPRALSYRSPKTHDCDSMFCSSLEPYVPPSHRKCQIVVSCLFKPGGFYCYVINEHSMAMEQLSNKLDSHCSRLQPPPRSRLTPGAYCGAYFEKRRCWCRAVVVSTKESRVQVQSVDYGNSAWIPDKEIRLLPCDFKQPPKLALTCRLADVEPTNGKWDHEYTNTIFNVLDASLDAMFIAEEGGDYVVKVPDITNKLIKQDLAYYCLESVH